MIEDNTAVLVPIGSWARWPEVQEYAKRYGIFESEAVIELVNTGLSHRRACEPLV